MNIDSLKNLPDLTVPDGLHGKIMRRVLFLKFRTMLVLVHAFLLVNLGLLVNSITVHIAQHGSFGILQQVLQDFDLSADYFGSLFSMTFAVLPVHLILISLLNIALILYVGFLSLELKKYVSKPLAKTS